MDEARKMVYSFLTLPYDVRLDIARDLNLLESEDEEVHGIPLFKRVFARAAKKGLIMDIKTAVDMKFKELGEKYGEI